MATYQTLGIILHKVDYGESSQLFYLYTQHLGKVEAVARGSKKIKSKLNSHLQFFAIIDLTIAKGKMFEQLAGAMLNKNFTNLKNDFKKIILASFGLELTDQLTKPNQPDLNIFNLLIRYLEAIDKKAINKKDDFVILKNHFTVELLTLLGYRPTPDIINNNNKLNSFLKNHLDSELKVEKFIAQLK